MLTLSSTKRDSTPAIAKYFVDKSLHIIVMNFGGNNACSGKPTHLLFPSPSALSAVILRVVFGPVSGDERFYF